MILEGLIFDDDGVLRPWCVLAMLLTVCMGAFLFLVTSKSYGCNRVCTANGDENAYHWATQCYCKDVKGFYNPKEQWR